MLKSHHTTVVFKVVFSLQHYRNDEYPDEMGDWDFHLTVRESEPPQRSSILESSQRSTELDPASKETSQNHVSDLPAAGAMATPITTPTAPTTTTTTTTAAAQQQVGKEESTGKEGGAQRLSNGHVSPPPPPLTGQSPPSSTLQDCRLSTLSTESNSSSLSNGMVFPTEQELSSMGEESSQQAVDDSQTRHRHESAKSITEETKELDEYLSRNSVTSVLTESQEGGGAMGMGLSHAREFERIGGSSEEDLERGGEEASGLDQVSQQGDQKEVCVLYKCMQ